jgi:hypothetical protein
MTSRITKAEGSADGVHRLVDMVVEEVSLVDRAANKHRFLRPMRRRTTPRPRRLMTPIRTRGPSPMARPSVRRSRRSRA